MPGLAWPRARATELRKRTMLEGEPSEAIEKSGPSLMLITVSYRETLSFHVHMHSTLNKDAQIPYSIQQSIQYAFFLCE